MSERYIVCNVKIEGGYYCGPHLAEEAGSPPTSARRLSQTLLELSGQQPTKKPSLDSVASKLQHIKSQKKVPLF